VGDGNINYVYVLEGPAGSLCLKQGHPYVRIMKSWKLTQVTSAAVMGSFHPGQAHSRSLQGQTHEVQHSIRNAFCRAYCAGPGQGGGGGAG
jgi:hypothetical protein